MTRFTTATAAALALCAAGPAAAAESARADVYDRSGSLVGGVAARATASGRTILTISFEGLNPGVHGAHVHETGDCSAEDFSSAGGHLAGDATHGVYTDNGPHPGDLPNITLDEEGTVQVEYFVSDLAVDDLLDEDGAAFVVHSDPDDYESQPSGSAGDRIACGEFAEN